MNPVLIKDLLNEFIDFFIEKSKFLFICLRIRPISIRRTKLFHYKMTLYYLHKLCYNERIIVLILFICISAINLRRPSMLIHE